MSLQLLYRWKYDSDQCPPGIQGRVKRNREWVNLKDIENFSLEDFLFVVKEEIEACVAGGYTHWIIEKETKKVVWEQNCNGCKFCLEQK